MHEIVDRRKGKKTPVLDPFLQASRPAASYSVSLFQPKALRLCGGGTQIHSNLHFLAFSTLGTTDAKSCAAASSTSLHTFYHFLFCWKEASLALLLAKQENPPSVHAWFHVHHLKLPQPVYAEAAQNIDL